MRRGCLGLRLWVSRDSKLTCVMSETQLSWPASLSEMRLSWLACDGPPVASLSEIIEDLQKPTSLGSILKNNDSLISWLENPIVQWFIWSFLNLVAFWQIGLSSKAIFLFLCYPLHFCLLLVYAELSGIWISFLTTSCCLAISFSFQTHQHTPNELKTYYIVYERVIKFLIDGIVWGKNNWYLQQSFVLFSLKFISLCTSELAFTLERQ